MVPERVTNGQKGESGDLRSSRKGDHLVGMVGVEPTRGVTPRVFETRTSASSVTSPQHLSVACSLFPGG